MQGPPAIGVLVQSTRIDSVCVLCRTRAVVNNALNTCSTPRDECFVCKAEQTSGERMAGRGIDLCKSCAHTHPLHYTTNYISHHPNTKPARIYTVDIEPNIGKCSYFVIFNETSSSSSNIFPCYIIITQRIQSKWLD